MEFHIRLPITFVRGLIGSNGETARTLWQESGCEFRISAREYTDFRKVTLYGNVELGLRKLFELLAAQVENGERGAFSNMKEEHDFMFKVEVAPNQVGVVIGRGGVRAELLRRTACQVKIQPDGEIEICGKLEHIHNVMSIIWENIRYAPSHVLPAPYRIGSSSGPVVEVTIAIPCDAVGTLIGVKGKHITQIRRLFAGVQILISNEEDAAPLQCVTNGNVKEFCLDKTMRTITLRGKVADTVKCYQILTAHIV